MTENVHDSHLKFYDLDGPLTSEDAKNLLNQLKEGCDLCAWELDRNEKPCNMLAKIAKTAGIEYRKECLSDEELIGFATLSFSGPKIVEIAAHVAHCQKCSTILFVEGGLVDLALSSLNEEAASATDKALRTSENKRTELDQFLVILDNDGVPLYEFPYVSVPTGSPVIERREARISFEVFHSFFHAPWTIQWVDVRDRRNISFLKLPVAGETTDLPGEHKYSELIMSTILSRSSAANLPTETLSTTSGATNVPASSPSGLRITNFDGKKWTFSISEDGNSLIISVEDSSD